MQQPRSRPAAAAAAAAAAARSQRVPIPPPRSKKHLNTSSEATSAEAAPAVAVASSSGAAAASMPPSAFAAAAAARSSAKSDPAAPAAQAAAASSSSSALPPASSAASSARPARQPGLLFPPSWPQLPQSHVPAVPPLRSLAEWKKQLPQGKTGGIAKVAYFFCETGSPRWTPMCSLTRDMAERIGSDVLERALEQRASDFGLTKEELDGDVEWTLKEQHARLFCVEFLHAQRDQLFEVVSGPTSALERLLERLDDFDAWRAGQLKANTKPAEQLTFAAFMQQHKEELEAKLPRKRPRLSVTKSGAELETGAAVSSAATAELEQEAESLLLFHFLAACSVVVVPKLSHLKTRCSPEKWCDRLLSLERRLQVLCFPPLQAQLQNVLKHREFAALTQPFMPRYVPLHTRMGIGQSSVVAASSTEAKPTASSIAEGQAPKLWSDRVEYFHRPHNGVFAPTVVLPDSAQFISLTDSEQRKCIGEMMRLLREECRSGGWQVQQGQFVLKGSYASHSTLISVCETAKSMCDDIRFTVREGLAQCPAGQSAFILQPNLDGLAIRSTLFFNRGKYLFHTLNNRMLLPPTREQQAKMDDAPPPGEQVFTSLLIDVRGECHSWQRPQFHCQPQLVDFAIHAPSLAERSSRLVSTAGMTRVDLGAEFVHLENDQSEEQLISAQAQPHQWHLTGAGFVVRPFLNEIRGSLDFDFFSAQTSFDALAIIAETTAQQILALADEAQKRRAVMEAATSKAKASPAVKQEAVSASAVPSSSRPRSSCAVPTLTPSPPRRAMPPPPPQPPKQTKQATQTSSQPSKSQQQKSTTTSGARSSGSKRHRE